ncbi:DedA family protein [Altericroceibacterium xinjiangense]|uniref:DedA family protein n=1 Tax=Altericroceibacterium xinjiangense TaxID=762261 RepID=UPI000F7E36EA|nr:DedA family protein [Altericroceibacterium xinjiangense]
MNDFVIRMIEQGGYWGVALLMALENIIPPIPSEVIMGVGGVLVARGSMEYWTLLLVGTVGATAGNYPWYWIGHKWGYQRLKPFVNRYGRWLTVDWRDVEKAARFFERHGQWVVFVMRFSPFLRTIISLPAGLTHMPVWRFLVFTFVGTAIWNALLIEGGRRLAPLIEKYEAWVNGIVLVLVVLALASYVYRLVTWKPCDEDGE